MKLQTVNCIEWKISAFLNVTLQDEWFKRIAFVRRVFFSEDVLETLIAGEEGEFIETLDPREIGKTITGKRTICLNSCENIHIDCLSLFRHLSPPFERIIMHTLCLRVKLILAIYIYIYIYILSWLIVNVSMLIPATVWIKDTNMCTCMAMERVK